jgi:hypothetical protein
MGYQVCLSFGDDQIDRVRDHYDLESMSELRELIKERGKTAVLDPIPDDEVTI